MQNVAQHQAIRQAAFTADTSRYAKCVEMPRRNGWEIERDVIRGRAFDFSVRFLPDGLSRTDGLESLTESERVLLSQIQGRTYVNMFGLIERAIGARMLELSGTHWLGGQLAPVALVRFTDEELKRQELFRRIDGMIAAGMPDGYRFDADPNDVAREVLGKSTWAVLALICMIKLLAREHYRTSIAPESDTSQLYKDVFLFHWREQAQHAILDVLEWRRENAELSPRERDGAVDDLIALAGAMDRIIQHQAQADSAYFLAACGRSLSPAESEHVKNAMLAAYRWQYIVSGAQEECFGGILGEMITPQQGARIAGELAPIVESVQAYT